MKGLGMMRRTRLFLVTGLAAAVLTGVASTIPISAATAAQRSFPDVAISSPFYDAISWLAEQGVTTGYPDGTFRPRNQITREAMAAYLYRMDGSPDYTPPTASPFTDVPVNSMFYKEISWLNTTGITTGYVDGTFRPGNHITREAMAAFMNRYAQFTGEDATSSSSKVLFLDVPTGSAFAAEISWLASEGISTGWDAGSGCSTYRPKSAVTREAMAAFVYRFQTGNDTDAGPSGTCSPPPRGHGSLSGNAGTVKVGSGIKAGTYMSTVAAGDLCYWERLSGAGGSLDEIISNGIASKGKTIVTILASDAYFKTTDCGTWKPIPQLGSLNARTSIPGTSGMLLVGPDIQPGTYRSTSTGQCYWERLSAFDGRIDSIIASDFNSNKGSSIIVTISNNDSGFTTSGCGTWTRTN